MTRLVLILACAIAAASPPADAEAPVRLTAAQVAEDVEIARQAYARMHPGYARYGPAAETEAAWSAILEAADASSGMTLGDFYLAVQRALVTIRCDHTKAELPEPLRAARRTDPVYLPMRWRLVEGRAFVTAAADGVGLTYGDELLGIDGRSLAEIVAAVIGYIPVDGETTWGRRAGVSDSAEFLGGAVDHFGALIFDVGPQAALEIRRADGASETLVVDRVTYPAWADLDADRRASRNFKDAVRFERIGEDAAYLRIDTFVNYRDPVDPDAVYGPLFEALARENRRRLIIDLRRNGGGSTDAAHRLVAHLIAEPMRVVTDMRVATLDFADLRPFLSTWDARALNPRRVGFRKNEDGTFSLRRFVSDELDVIRPARSAFDGEIIFLTSDENASASTTLLAVLRGSDRVTLIGEPTGGSAEGPTAGLLFTLTLPESGIRTRLPFFRYTNNVDDPEPGRGVTPDIAAPMTVEAFLAQRDPAYEAALERIRAAAGALE